MNKFIFTFLTAITMATVFVAPIKAQQSSNYGITVVPAPGAVTIDGDLKDWDWSGRIWIYPNKAIASQYSLEVAAMWDYDNLYIAAHFKDPTPMMNLTDPRSQPGWGWRSDAMQFRFKTDQVLSVTAWYYTTEKIPVATFEYGKMDGLASTNQNFSLFKPGAADPTDLGKGVKEAFKVDADGKGYVQELSIPWNLLYAKVPRMEPGLVFKLGFEEFWGDASGGSAMPFQRFADNLQPGKMVDRIRFFGEVNGWGDATLSPTGHVETRLYPDEDAKFQGTVPIHYQLPATDVTLPKTYRVSLAITDPKNSKWIVSNFANGAVRTVTTENQGKFTEMWNGLDDNYMPVPAGTYGVKGIYMPAEAWPIDGDVHTLIPQLATSGSSWSQTPAEGDKPNKINGDPVGSPMSDVDVAANGKGVVYFQYLENGNNSYLTDFTKPIGYDQIITGYGSGSAAGGSASCTDGEQIWSFSTNGGQFIMHADGSPFGTQNSPGRHNVYLPEGWVKGMSAWRDPVSKKSVVFVAEGGRIAQGAKPWQFGESDADRVDRIVALDGADATKLGEWKIAKPLGVAARNGKLYVLHATDSGAEVVAFPLDSSWKEQRLQPLFAVPSDIKPFDVTADSHGRVYLSDSDANHVYQFDADGKKLRTYGKLDTQQEGHYDAESFMAPQKLSCWTDDKGQDRLMVVEMAGPNRLSEWSGDDGKLIRQWVTPQLQSNNGYGADPRQPDRIYMQGQGGSLVRWKVNYTTGEWVPEAVWQHFAVKFNGEDLETPLPRVIYHGDDRYITFTGGHTRSIIAYLLEGDKLRATAAVLTERVNNRNMGYIWRDLNGDGQIQDEEYKPFAFDLPPGIIMGKSFGNTWLDDLSVVCIGMGTPDIWRLAPTGFDDHKNPIYKDWQKLLTDDVFTARKAGGAPPLHGGNELANGFTSDWADVAQAPDGGFYVCARSGPNFSSNSGSQFKLSRYVPDGNGGFTQQWRVGRIALEGTARPGEAYSPIFVSNPVNGLVGIIDNSRAGMIVYTEDGLYVDTLLPDGKTISPDQRGSYYTPGEFFAGQSYLARDTGKVYLAMGKVMPMIYEIKNWTATENPTKPIMTIDDKVSIDVTQIVAPPEIALSMRASQPGAAVVAKSATFAPASSTPALDGSLTGWDAAAPVNYGAGETQTIEVRGLYDKDFVYLRWHARVGHAFEPKALLPSERIFTHDRLADTLGFYLQGDPKAVPGKGQRDGRSGDLRLVFGIFSDGGKTVPAVLGMYPKWLGSGPASSLSYNSPQGHVPFENVGLLSDAKLGYKIDEDGKGFVLAAAIPVADLPGVPSLSGWKTTGNFDANLGGTNKFWWTNTDGSASRETFDEPTEARFYPGSWSTIEFKSP